MKVIKAFGPGDLREKVRTSGICGSDKWLWSVKNKMDSVVGHKVSGEVEKLGNDVTDLSLGDRIMINNVGGCGLCPTCRANVYGVSY